MAASAAFTCEVEQTGTAVAMTGEACTTLTVTTAQVTDAAKRVLDPDTAISVIDDAVPLADTDVTIDYLRGIVTKTSGNWNGAVTITAAYLPRYQVAEAKAFEINFSSNLVDSTTMDSTTAYHAYTKALGEVSGTISQFDDLKTDLDSGGTTIVPFTDFTAGTRRVLSIVFPSGAYFRAFVRFESTKHGQGVDDLMNATLAWKATSATGTDQTEGQAAVWSTD